MLPLTVTSFSGINTDLMHNYYFVLQCQCQSQVTCSNGINKSRTVVLTTFDSSLTCTCWIQRRGHGWTAHTLASLFNFSLRIRMSTAPASPLLLPPFSLPPPPPLTNPGMNLVLWNYLYRQKMLPQAYKETGKILWVDSILLQHSLLSFWVDSILLQHSLLSFWVDSILLQHSLLSFWVDSILLQHSLLSFFLILSFFHSVFLPFLMHFFLCFSLSFFLFIYLFS